MFNLDRKVFSHFDYMIVFTSVPVVLLSLHLIFEIDSALTIKQLFYIAFTLAVSAFVFILPLKNILWITPILYWGAIALLLAVEIFGVDRWGARRWLEIPFIGMSLQPSEIMKIALIMMMAYNINNDPPPPEGYNLKQFLKHSFYILLPVVLVKIQPDLGTSVLIFICGYAVLFLVGISRRILMASCLLLIIAMPIVYMGLSDYQLKRIESFIGANDNSDSAYQVQQSIIAIGSGGLTGKSVENATQAQLKFLPVPESDFIFAYFCERYGFIGGFVLLLLYGLLILQLISLSHQYRKDRILQVVSASIGFLIFIHLSVNILMVMKLAPVVGIPLPFFSYGGSSFLTFGVLFAVLENLLAFKYNFRV